MKVLLPMKKPIIYSLAFFTTISVQASEINPNGSPPRQEQGWSLWRPNYEIEKAGFDAGFSNMELGGYLDFENACKTNPTVGNSSISYWFRLSNSVERIGTGRVEYSCWANGRRLHTFDSTAIKSGLENVNCLRVNSPTGLTIRSEPRNNSRGLGRVAQGRTVRPNSFPASIVEADGENWIAITSPRPGWVSDGKPTSQGNFSLCNR
ncbi:hypothetical protein [Microseira sp. BLCC-F43]|uniref:hypothetical protein n=1 Tax=Microseira sp. BLCC-F43 TaxID=3153602 RepID=UPI0035BAEB12